MKIIQLTQGKVALIDDEDFERVAKHKWAAEKCKSGWYAITNTSHWKRLHRLILQPTHGMVDHKNGDGLDCQRKNLRVCDFFGNAQNARKKTPNGHSTSRFKGVYFDSRPLAKPWQAHIRTEKKHKHLGYFSTETEAAAAYNSAAARLYGEFARLNVI